jgi:glycosyltransferase involved in cell wall biosynthesis
LIFNSNWTRNLFMKEYGLSGVVCHPAIDTRRHTISNHGDNVVTASRHYPWKRIDLAFHVMRRLRTAHPRLLVTGEETSHTPTLKAIANRLGLSEQVEFTGFVSDSRLNSIYSRAGAYVQTSIFEPFGLGPLEAQSRGAPAVVWGDAGARETVLDGETGFYATPYSVNDYAGKLELILTDDDRRREMSRSARDWANSFDWETHIDILEGVLDAERR